MPGDCGAVVLGVVVIKLENDRFSRLKVDKLQCIFEG